MRCGFLKIKQRFYSNDTFLYHDFSLKMGTVLTLPVSWVDYGKLEKMDMTLL
jgi:hypothetical protein